MIAYIYDNSFEGLLTSIYDSFYKGPKPDEIVPIRDFQENFLNTSIFIKTDIKKFKKVYNSIKSKISENALENAYNAFLSETPGISTCIYHYLLFGWKKGHDLDLYITDTTVLNIHKAVLKVTGEKHRLLGLVRFKKIKGDIYYASIEPDHNVLSMLAQHFTDRLSDQRWIIHDLKRNTAAVYDRKRWFTRTLYSKSSDPFNPSVIKDSDMDYENLWKLYFKHISIESKRNIKLQKQHMPSRYWYHLTEKKF